MSIICEKVFRLIRPHPQLPSAPYVQKLIIPLSNWQEISIQTVYNLDVAKQEHIMGGFQRRDKS